jgi:hypothetical protein
MVGSNAKLLFVSLQSLVQKISSPENLKKKNEAPGVSLYSQSCNGWIVGTNETLMPPHQKRSSKSYCSSQGELVSALPN